MQTQETSEQPKTAVGSTDWLDAGYLGLLAALEMWLWWKTGFSWIVLVYGFVCACRGSQLSHMRNEGVWKRLWGKASNEVLSNGGRTP